MKIRKPHKPAITFRLLLGILAIAVLCLLAARSFERFAVLALVLRLVALALICFSLYKSDKAFKDKSSHAAEHR